MKLNIYLLGKHVVRSLHERGVRATFSGALGYLKRDHSPDSFDLAHGTSTGGVEQLWQYSISSPNARYGTRYQPTDYQELQQMFGLIQEDLGTFSFIDLGCGKGRVLLQASEMGFKHVIGVEFASELVAIARSNAAKLVGADISVVHADASEFQFPQGEDLVIYLFNPFEEKVMRKVLSNLRGTTRRLYVIYNNPRCAELFDTSGFLNRVGCMAAGRYPIVIWKAARLGDHLAAG